MTIPQSCLSPDGGSGIPRGRCHYTGLYWAPPPARQHTAGLCWTHSPPETRCPHCSGTAQGQMHQAVDSMAVICTPDVWRGCHEIKSHVTVPLWATKDDPKNHYNSVYNIRMNYKKKKNLKWCDDTHHIYAVKDTVSSCGTNEQGPLLSARVVSEVIFHLSRRRSGEYACPPWSNSREAGRMRSLGWFLAAARLAGDQQAETAFWSVSARSEKRAGLIHIYIPVPVSSSVESPAYEVVHVTSFLPSWRDLHGSAFLSML